MIIVNITEAAEKSASTNEFLPAIIGLGGVLIGGIIQVLMQRHTMVESQIEKIRSECAEVTVAVASYGVVSVQAAGAFEEAVSDFKKRKQTNPWAKFKIGLGDDYWDRLGESFSEGFRESYRLTILLSGAKDAKISAQAMKLHHAITDFHNEVAPLFIAQRISTAQNEVDEKRQALNVEANVLLSMVTPRYLERYSRFRSASIARRSVEKLLLNAKNKKAKQKEAEGHEPVRDDDNGSSQAVGVGSDSGADSPQDGPQR